MPSKGRLQEETIAWFGGARRHAGAQRRRARVPRHACAASTGSSWCCSSAAEIPRELAAGRLHLGVTGQDLVREEIPRWEERLEELAPMGFGFADLVVAVPAFWIDVADMSDLDAAAAEFRARHGHRLRVATKYHHLVREFFQAHGVADYQLVDSQGATEGAVKNLTAEAVADITTTGSTLRDNHLRVLDDGLILRSQATLFVARATRAAGTATAGRAPALRRARARRLGPADAGRPIALERPRGAGSASRARRVSLRRVAKSTSSIRLVPSASGTMTRYSVQDGARRPACCGGSRPARRCGSAPRRPAPRWCSSGTAPAAASAPGCAGPPRSSRGS